MSDPPMTADSGARPGLHLFLSPHPDDAALSCGGLIRRLAGTGQRVAIVTLCTRGPEPRARLPLSVRLWRAQCGAPGDIEAVRRSEDRAAAADLGVRVVDLRLRDAALRLDPRGRALYDESPVGSPIHAEDRRTHARALERRLRTLRRLLRDPPRVYVPLAEDGHVDHRLSMAAAERVFGEGRIVYYEDFPPRSSLATRRREGRGLVRLRLGPQELESKLDAVWCYGSQLLWLFGSRPARLSAKLAACASAASGIPLPMPAPPRRSGRPGHAGPLHRALEEERYWWPAAGPDATAARAITGRVAVGEAGESRAPAGGSPAPVGTGRPRVGGGTGGSTGRPLRVLLVNAFHYLRGGVERAYLDESRWLEAAGHTVGHFAIRHPQNLPSPTSDFFAPFADYGENARSLRLLVQLPRTIWSGAAERAAARLVDSFRPDVAHVHAPSRYLTPAVLRPLQRAGVPIVMTLHDFKPWCTNRMLFADGAHCERCRGGRHWRALTAGCVQGSRLKSAVGMVEAYVHDTLDAYRPVALWIAPSRFVEEQARVLGVPACRLRRLGHAVAPRPAATASAGRAGCPAGPFVLYAGRLAVEKGARLLPAIARGLGEATLVVAGDGPLRGELESAAPRMPNLQVMRHRGDAELRALRLGAGAVVVPSVVAETFCYAVAEALMDARPVVASRIGAIPELIRHEVSGLLVEPGDVQGFVAALRRALACPEAPAWGRAGRAALEAALSPERHTAGLVEIYRAALDAGASRGSRPGVVPGCSGDGS